MYDYSLDNLPDWYPERFSFDMIKFDSRITAIGDCAFISFMNLNNSKRYPLILPSKLTKIGNGAFLNGLASELVLPEEVAYIGDEAFNLFGITDVKTCVFPKGVKYLGDWAMPKGIDMEVDMEGIEHLGGGTFALNRCTFKSFDIPDSIQYIGFRAFYENESISGELVIPDSVSFVGEQAFAHCPNLTGKVQLLGVTSIEDGVFYKTGITEVTYGDKVTAVNIDLLHPFADSITKVTFNHEYFEGMTDLFTQMNKVGHKISIYYPKGKGWPTKYSYENLTFIPFGEDPRPEPKEKTRSISKAKVTGLQNCVFDGTPHNDQKLTVKYGDEILEEGVHYTLEWNKYTYPGTGTVVVKGIKENGFSGKKTLTFKIAKADINDVCVVYVNNVENSNVEPEVTYTKGKTTPEVVVIFKDGNGQEILLEKGVDFKVTYKNNTKVNDGTGKKVPTVIITGKKYFKGTIKKTFKIKISSITNCTATAKNVRYKKSKGNYKTTIVVKDSNGKKLTPGKDYDSKNMVFTVDSTGAALTGKENLAVGTKITVTIKGLGNYASSGTISCSYEITK
jgi:hypothetical protein